MLFESSTMILSGSIPPALTLTRAPPCDTSNRAAGTNDPSANLMRMDRLIVRRENFRLSTFIVGSIKKHVVLKMYLSQSNFDTELLILDKWCKRIGTQNSRNCRVLY